MTVIPGDTYAERAAAGTLNGRNTDAPFSGGGAAGPAGPAGPTGSAGAAGAAGAQGASLNPRGTWNSSMTIQKLDVVSYLTGSYVALNNVAPGGASPAVDTTNWAVVGTGIGEIAYAEITANWGMTTPGALVANQFVDIPGLSIVIPAGTGTYQLEALLPAVQISWGASATAATTADVHTSLVDEGNVLLAQSIWRTHAPAASGSAFNNLAIRKRMPATASQKTIRVQLATSLITNVANIIIWANAGNVTPQGINNMGPSFIQAVTR